MRTLYSNLSIMMALMTLTPIDAAAKNQCADPGEQLPCYCTSQHIQPASSGHVVSPCFGNVVQFGTFYNFAQFSTFAWSGLNWPLGNKDGTPDYRQDLSKVDGDSAPVWESWKTNYDVFRADGSTPYPWTSRKRDIPEACATIDLDKAKREIPRQALVPDRLPPRFLPDYVNAEGDVLIDLNGRLVRYETAMNETAFDYIVDNKLYNADDLRKFVAGGNRIDFPLGTYNVNERGSFWVKAAWKPLGAGDDFKSFHKSWAYLYPTVKDGTIVSECKVAVVGLVGLHITYKLSAAPRWAWATFEHINNAPGWHELSDAKRPYSFYDPSCAVVPTTAAGDRNAQRDPTGEPPKDCAAINTKPRLFRGAGKAPQPSQLVMQQNYGYGYVCDNPDCGNTGLEAFNDLLAHELASSVWGNYRLKGTQWFQANTALKPAMVRPPILANTVIEPYIQETSSCLGCHDGATIMGESLTHKFVPNSEPSDRIFALQRARPKLVSAP